MNGEWKTSFSCRFYTGPREEAKSFSILMSVLTRRFPHCLMEALMKKNPAPYLALFACAFLVAGFARSVGATTATWTNSAGGNAWETGGNWDINQVPTNDTFDVTIPISAACNLSNQYEMAAVNL